MPTPDSWPSRRQRHAHRTTTRRRRITHRGVGTFLAVFLLSLTAYPAAAAILNRVPVGGTAQLADLADPLGAGRIIAAAGTYEPGGIDCRNVDTDPATQKITMHAVAPLRTVHGRKVAAEALCVVAVRIRNTGQTPLVVTGFPLQLPPGWTMDPILPKGPIPPGQTGDVGATLHTTPAAVGGDVAGSLNTTDA